MSKSPTELLSKYRLRLKKRLGQNLLLDPNINRRMVEFACLTEQDTVVEVGTGIGSLTTFLEDVAARVITIEIDTAFAPLLEELLEHRANVRVVFEDILNIDIPALIAEHCPDVSSLKMVSNLPYYSATAIIMRFLECPVPFQSMTVMVQKEVAQRMTARPGSKDCAALSLLTQFYCKPEIRHLVSRNCFRPRPRVDSAILTLIPHDTFRVSDEERDFLFDIIVSAFQQRRKTLSNALAASGRLSLTRKEVSSGLESCGIDPHRRGETLSLKEFILVARHFMEQPSPEDTSVRPRHN